MSMNEVSRLLDVADNRFEANFTKLPRLGQPLHTVYIPAHKYRSGIAVEWGDQASDLVRRHGGFIALASGLGVLPEFIERVAAGVEVALSEHPIRDLRIDFEDGYGHPEWDQEDRDAVAAAEAVARDIAQGISPRSLGIRFKSLNRPTRERGIRTLRIFLSTLVEKGSFPEVLALTLPKVVAPEQVQAMALLCTVLEQDLGLDDDSLRFEVQVEAPQLVVGADGTLGAAPSIAAGKGRVSAFHYGTYDYAAASGVAAVNHSLAHPVAEFAKRSIQAAISGTGVWISDGSSNEVPSGDAAQVWKAWRLQADLVNQALTSGIYQGWDLHPGQLAARYCSTYSFYHQGLQGTAQRLRAYLDQNEGGVMDEPATARALAEFLLRAVDNGAVAASEIEKACGSTVEELHTIAFAGFVGT